MVLEASTSVATLEAVYPKRLQSQRSDPIDTGGVSLRRYPKWIPYLMALLTIIAGVFSSMTSTWMNKQRAPMCNGCKDEDFVGAMLQTQQMFIAETIAFFVWWCDYTFSARLKKAPLFEFVIDPIELSSQGTKKGHWWYWPFCACCDFAATLLVNHAYQFTFAATVEMLRNFMVVTAAIFQIILIRRAVVVHQWMGIALITVAMILTAVPAILTPDDSLGETSVGRTIVGVALAIGGTTIQAFQLCVEEWFFCRGRYPPLKAVGIEGVTGLILTFIAWPIYQTTKAEDVTGSWYQQFHNRALVGIAIGYLPCGSIFNICGLGTTKLAGGLLRGVCFAVRAPLVWILSMIVHWQGYDSYSLASALVFAFGFTVYCNFYGLLPGPEDPTNYESDKYLWLRKPVSCCCTRIELNEPPFNGAIEPKTSPATTPQIATPDTNV